MAQEKPRTLGALFLGFAVREAIGKRGASSPCQAVQPIGIIQTTLRTNLLVQLVLETIALFHHTKGMDQVDQVARVHEPTTQSRSNSATHIWNFQS